MQAVFLRQARNAVTIDLEPVPCGDRRQSTRVGRARLARAGRPSPRSSARIRPARSSRESGRARTVVPEGVPLAARLEDRSPGSPETTSSPRRAPTRPSRTKLYSSSRLSVKRRGECSRRDRMLDERETSAGLLAGEHESHAHRPEHPGPAVGGPEHTRSLRLVHADRPSSRIVHGWIAATTRRAGSHSGPERWTTGIAMPSSISAARRSASPLPSPGVRVPGRPDRSRRVRVSHGSLGLRAARDRSAPPRLRDRRRPRGAVPHRCASRRSAARARSLPAADRPRAVRVRPRGDGRRGDRARVPIAVPGVRARARRLRCARSRGVDRGQPLGLALARRRRQARRGRAVLREASRIAGKRVSVGCDEARDYVGYVQHAGTASRSWAAIVPTSLPRSASPSTACRSRATKEEARPRARSRSSHTRPGISVARATRLRPSATRSSRGSS